MIMKKNFIFLLLAILSGMSASSQTYYELDFSSQFNFNLSQDTYGGNFVSMPTGTNVFFDSIPYRVYPWTDAVNGWNANFAPGSNPVILDIPCNNTITGLNLLANTYWGQGGPGSYASVQFWHSGNMVFEKTLVGNVDVRDYNQNTWTNSINETTTTIAWTDGSHRSDNIHIVLPSSMAIDSVLVVDNGGSNFQRIFVLAATAENSVKPAREPGSGNGLLFDGTKSQYVYIGNNLDPAGSFTFETWVKRSTLAVTDAQVQLFIGSFDDNGWGVGIQQASGTNKINLTQIGTSNVLSASSITDTFWHHVAVTYDAVNKQAQFFIDGIADPPVSYNPNFNSGNSNYELGGRNPFGDVNQLNFLNGTMDEIRIWNTVLTPTEIKDWMCKKITPAHPAYSNLIRYYNFDEDSGKTVFDYSASQQNGTIINNPTRVVSGASIGDASAYDYTNPTKTANITAASGENFAVTNTSGNPDGLQVYMVDGIPNTTSGANSGKDSTYFGVFQVNGASPTYTAVYNYNGNPFVNAGDENQSRLFKRHNNADTIWTDCNAILNTTNKTLTTTGQSTEYILGVTSGTLPINLISFNGKLDDNKAQLVWIAATESGTKGFGVQRSLDGVNFTDIGFVNNSHSPGTNSYSFTDMNITSGANFYRLKEINLDGNFAYSQVISLNYSKFGWSILGNPFHNNTMLQLQLDKQANISVQVFSISGKIVQSINEGNIAPGTYSIALLNSVNVSAGVYLVKLTMNSTCYSTKILKK